jgi:hypothetical protein
MEAIVEVDRMSASLMKILAWARALGPYAAIELLMPGGSLIALLLWVCRTQLRKRLLCTDTARLA